MSGVRLDVRLFFQDMTIEQVNKEFPALLPAIKAAKAKASNLPNEMTVKAQYHICRHDEGRPCDPRVEIEEASGV